MKKILLLLASIGAINIATAQMTHRTENFEGVRLTNVEMKRSGDVLHIGMIMEFGSKHMHTNSSIIYTPVLFHANDELRLQSVGVHGRNHYYAMLRSEEHNDEIPLDWQLSRKDLPARVEYNVEVEYEPWMNGSHLAIVEQEYGCGNKLLAAGDIIVGEYVEPAIVPTYIFVIPERVESGKEHHTESAHVDFAVRKTTIDPNFNGNSHEIELINRSMDSLRSNNGIVVTKVVVRGSASPEGGSKLNDELAHGRADALIKLISAHYKIPSGALTTLYKTNQWAEISKWVEQSTLTHRKEIVRLLSSDENPDLINTMIMKHYPEDYERMLTEFYPTLRSAEYDIEYDVATYKDVDEIVAIAIATPSSLTTDELNIAASAMDQNSPSFDNVILTIVAREPNNASANINAANVAMRRGELKHAEKYLLRAGNSAEADYARAIYAIANGNYGEAKRLLRHVEKKIAHASKLLNKLERMGL